MTHEVLVSRQAEDDLNQAADWIAEDAPDTAASWFNGFVKALLSLGEQPERCPLARENSLFSFDLRQLLYGRRRNYRALFVVNEQTVTVLAIRHTAQAPLTEKDLLG